MFLTRFAMTIWRAMIDASSYIDEFVTKRTSTALGYLYYVNTTLAFFMLLPFAVGMAVLAPSARMIADEQLRIVQDWYPDELVLTITGGILSTNQPQPVILDVPEEWKMDSNKETSAHAVVIDVNATIDDFERYNTAILLTQKALIGRDKNSLRSYPFTQFDEGIIITETSIATNIDLLRRNITPYLPAIAWCSVVALLLIVPWIAGGAAWITHLLFLLWASLVLLIVSGFMGRGLRYDQLYRLGAYGVTSSLLLGFALTMTGLQISFGTYILFFGWMIFVLSRFPQGTAMIIRPPLPPATTKAATEGGARASAKSKPTKKGL